MRGLKLRDRRKQASKACVASFTDAWIETHKGGSRKSLTEVASFTDAWIETKRGTTTREIGSVASFTDAWIETSLIM